MASTPNFPYPAAAFTVLATRNPVDATDIGAAPGQLWIRTDNNNVWYWDGISHWVPLITN